MPTTQQLIRIALAMTCGLLIGPSAGLAQVPVSKEYQVKAAFLYNFTKFVEWPAGRLENDTAPIIIAVLGVNPFGDELEKIAHNRKVYEHCIVVEFVHSAKEARGAHVVFVAADEEEHCAREIAALGAAGVLTVGESAHFSTLGGVVTFTTVGDKVRFEINMTVADEGGLKISAQLQKLASVVHRKP